MKGVQRLQWQHRMDWLQREHRMDWLQWEYRVCGEYGMDWF